MGRIPVGLQMYTLRNEMAQDPIGTIRKVAEIGYEGIEALPWEGISVEDYRKLLDDLGLKTPGGHVPLEALEADLNAVVDLYLALGATYVTVPYLAEERRKTGDDWRRLAEIMTEIGEKLATQGLVLSYHNHSFEFQTFDGKYGFDIFFETADPRYVKSQLDTYWVKHGGEDPAAYIRKLDHRTPLIHLKDMGEDGSFAEVGEGILDWEAIFDASEANGAVWYLVEQDTCKRPPIEAVAVSLDNLRAMGKLG